MHRFTSNQHQNDHRRHILHIVEYDSPAKTHYDICLFVSLPFVGAEMERLHE